MYQNSGPMVSNMLFVTALSCACLKGESGCVLVCRQQDEIAERVSGLGLHFWQGV